MDNFAALFTSLSSHTKYQCGYLRLLNLPSKKETGTANDETLITNHLDQSNHLAIQ
jgi:hypothetical protein